MHHLLLITVNKDRARTSEDEARKLFNEYIGEFGIDETEIIDIYEVEVPQSVIDSYKGIKCE